MIENTKDNLDRIDRHMLMVIQQQGRLSVSDLSDIVGLSPSPCARRLKRLEDEGYIEGYHATLNPAKIGITMRFFIEVRLSNHQAESIASFEEEISNMEEVVSPDIDGYESLTRKFHRIKSVKDLHTHLSVRKIKTAKSYPIYIN